MGAVASTNLYYVGNLRTMLQQKDQMIAELQSQLKETERSISREINKGLEQARFNDIQEIQKLKASLDEANLKIQVGRAQVLQQEEMNRQLQNKINSIQNQVVELEIFRAQALEIRTKIEKEQHEVFFKLEFIQNYFQEASKSLESILLEEREVKVARKPFQKAVTLSTKKEVRETQKLYVSEKIKGDIIIKVWEEKLAENKRITREVNDDYQGIFDLLEKASLNIGRNNCLGLLGEINIGKHQLRFKEDLEEIQVEIPQIKVINVTQIEKWIIMPNLKSKTSKFTRKIIKDHLPEL
jgi:chromosome segregation ATPase